MKVDETPRTLEELKEGAKITTSNVSAIGESITPSITGKLPNLATSFTLQKAKMIEFEDAAFSAVETALAFGTKGNVNIQANEVNMSGTMLDKFANAFREFLEFGSRNVVVNNTNVRGGDQNMQGGRITANVLSNPDPVIQGITRQALF